MSVPLSRGLRGETVNSGEAAFSGRVARPADFHGSAQRRGRDWSQTVEALIQARASSEFIEMESSDYDDFRKEPRQMHRGADPASAACGGARDLRATETRQSVMSVHSAFASMPVKCSMRSNTRVLPFSSRSRARKRSMASRKSWSVIFLDRKSRS
ncbi:hypothetical protein ACTMU2_40765 [Cupriavidus basilensis]